MSIDQPGQTITQEDVARHAGVSRAIVSYVLNNGPRKVSEPTRIRVLNAIEELGYRPNKYAQRLKLGADAARNSIGIVAGGKGSNLLERPYYTVILANLFDRANALGQHIRFFSFFDALQDPVFFNKNIHREEISSLIMLLPQVIEADPSSSLILSKVVERIDNIVCLEHSIRGLPAMVLDLGAAAQMAVEHLIGLGHTRIGFLALDDARIPGYRRALALHNLPFDDAITRTLDGSKILTSAYEQTISLIQTRPHITALFAANDEAAVAAMSAIHDHGLRVPEDIAITSIDNTEIASIVRPALTTVNLPRAEMVDHALRFLLSQRDHPGVSPASIMMPLELVVRESCGAKQGHALQQITPSPESKHI